MEAIASRVEGIAIRLEAIASRFLGSLNIYLKNTSKKQRVKESLLIDFSVPSRADRWGHNLATHEVPRGLRRLHGGRLKQHGAVHGHLALSHLVRVLCRAEGGLRSSEVSFLSSFITQKDGFHLASV